MHLATALATTVAESGGHGNVALETLPFGIVALVVFGLLALVASSYRHVSNRHTSAEERAEDAKGHGH